MLSTENIYKVVYEYTKEQPDIKDGKRTLDEILRTWEPIPANKPSASPGYVGTLVNLLALLQADIYTQANKTAGKGNIERAMKAVIKSAPDYKSALKGVAFLDGRPYVCDGQRVIMPFEPVELGKQVEGIASIAEIMTKTREETDKPLDLPTLPELKAYINIKKAEKTSKYDKARVYWFFREKERPAVITAVNAVFLLDMLTAFPDAQARYKDKLSSIYFAGKDGEGALCPVRLKDESED